jgi:hypothetical protein
MQISNQKKCVFSIVAKNYIGLATILGNSLKKFDNDIDFFVLVADEFTSEDQSDVLPQNVLFGKEVLDYTDKQWIDMSFKYELTALCTAIKPACFQYLFSLGYHKIIYFDPDIYVFSSIRSVFELLDNHSIVVVPHISGLHINYKGDHPESSILWHGIYNLGFCAISKSKESDLMLEWWKTRLIDKGFADVAGRYFYDQKWIDMLSGFFETNVFYVCRNLGMNLAPWNFYEREVIRKNGTYYVKFRELNEPREDILIFAHFAGYNYSELKRGNIKRLRLQIKEYPDIQMITKDYITALNKNEATFDRYINLPYTYGTFNDGTTVERFHRSIYHGLVKNGKSFTNPFDSKGVLFSLFKRHKMFSKSASVGKYNLNNYPNLEKRKRQLNKLFKLAYKILGYERYFTLVRALNLYTLQENHSFLLDD